MASELQQFKDLVMTLFRDGVAYLRKNRLNEGKPGGHVKWFPDEFSLSKVLKSPKGDFGEHIVPLRQPTGFHDKTLVGLWCSWDFKREDPRCKMEILIHRADKQVFGFRVEPPHDDGKEIKHKYWHAQYTHNFSQAGTGFPQASGDVNWISPSTPAYPLALDGSGKVMPKDATVYATVSLYGRNLPPDIFDKLKEAAAYSASLKTIVLGAVAA